MHPIQLDSVYFPHKRYVSLRIIGVILTVLGALALAVACVCGLVLLFGFLAAGKSDYREDQVALAMASGSAVTVGGPALVASLVFFAHAAMIHLSIHVEENTRATAQLLHGLCKRLPAPAILAPRGNLPTQHAPNAAEHHPDAHRPQQSPGQTTEDSRNTDSH